MSGSKGYVANVGVRYPKDPDKWGDDDAPRKDVPAGGAVDEYAVKQSPWLLDQGKVSPRRSAGLVVDEAVKAKLAAEEVTP